MIYQPIRLLVVLPEVPGDLVCCRYAVRLFADQSIVTVLLRKSHAGLIADLPVAIVLVDGYSDLATISLNKIFPNNSYFNYIVDLHNDTCTFNFVFRFSSLTIGFSEPDVGIIYDQSFPWRTPPIEGVHSAVRHSRAVPGHLTAVNFDVASWKRAFYVPRLPLQADRIAFCPGSSMAGKEKRVSPIAWKNTADYIRGLGKHIVWFLGPDEQELYTVLVLPCDTVQSGSFDSVIIEHSSCKFGISHDTVHLHIRAHLPVETCALFVRGEEREWGGYPSGVFILRAPTSELPSTVSLAMIRWLDHATADC